MINEYPYSTLKTAFNWRRHNGWTSYLSENQLYATYWNVMLPKKRKALTDTFVRRPNVQDIQRCNDSSVKRSHAIDNMWHFSTCDIGKDKHTTVKSDVAWSDVPKSAIELMLPIESEQRNEKRWERIRKKNKSPERRERSKQDAQKKENWTCSVSLVTR